MDGPFTVYQRNIQSLAIKTFKVGPSLYEKICVVCFIESPLKMTKNFLEKFALFASLEAL